MSITIKILLALLPFFGAGYIGFNLLKPALDDSAAQAIALAQKHDSNERLESKLTSDRKIRHKKEDLTKEIAALEETVPKTQDPELLTIDLEHMCKDASMDLISIDSGKGNTSKKPEVNTPPPAPTSASPNKNIGSTVSPVTNVQEFTKEIIVTGSFRNLEKLIYDLETYQKAIKISELVSRIPKGKDKSSTTVSTSTSANTSSLANTSAQTEDNKLPDDSAPGEDDALGDPNELYISMKITAYYLP